MAYRIEAQALNREMLRAAGEHLGTLAERQKEAYDLGVRNRIAVRVTNRHYDRYAKLLRLSREVLDIANGD